MSGSAGGGAFGGFRDTSGGAFGTDPFVRP